MKYEDLVFKIPQESPTYREDSAFVIRQITSILDARKNANDNKIIINTNLRMGLPLENINKIAGPMIEAWAGEVFAGIKGTLEIKGNDYVVIDVNGVGYKIFAPLSTIERLGEIGSTVKVHTHYYVREDNSVGKKLKHGLAKCLRVLEMKPTMSITLLM